MGKLKEKLLNNLTPEEMDERFGISAFEYVEYMENYKNYRQLSLFDDNGDPINEDVLEQIHKERMQLENDYYEQQYINELNESNKLKYTDNDVLAVITKVTTDTVLIDRILGEFRDIWNTKNGFFE